jgi:hypothetical protein
MTTTVDNAWLAMSSLCKWGEIREKDLIGEVGCSESELKTALSLLQKAGYVIIQGQGRGSKFMGTVGVPLQAVHILSSVVFGMGKALTKNTGPISSKDFVEKGRLITVTAVGKESWRKKKELDKNS